MNEILGEINIAYVVRKFIVMCKRKQCCYFLVHFVDEPRSHTTQCLVFLRVFLLPILIHTYVPRARVCMPDTHKTPHVGTNCLVTFQYYMEV